MMDGGKWTRSHKCHGDGAMIQLKTREDVITHAEVVFKTAPFLVDLVLALSDPDRVCVVSGPKDGFQEARWPVEEK